MTLGLNQSGITGIKNRDYRDYRDYRDLTNPCKKHLFLIEFKDDLIFYNLLLLNYIF
jgi:hypothetical protein